MRPPHACLGCRNRRRKCNPTRPGQPCLLCQKRNVHCSLTLHVEAKREAITAHQELNTVLTNPDFPPQEVVRELIELYFKYIHDTTQWIFHQPSTLQDFDRGNLPRSLILGMMSLSARFSNHEYFISIEPRDRGKRYAEEAEKLLNVRDMSITTIQLSLLLGAFFSTEGEPTSDAAYYSIGCRVAALMGLVTTTVSPRTIQDELEIRLAWTLIMCDVWSSKGNRIPQVFPVVPNSYPMEESLYLSMRRGNSNSIQSLTIVEDPNSLLLQMIKLNGIFEEISDFITGAAAQQTIQDVLPTILVNQLGSKLDTWYNTLPITLQDTELNLMTQSAKGLGHIFVSVYLGYYHYGQVLYYQFLHNDCFSNTTTPDPYAARCRAFSSGLCDLVYRAYETPGAEVYYSMIGHVLAIASTVQVHILLFSTDEAEIASARTRLARNFAILTELQHFWPILDVCLKRFQEFHKTCQRYQESSFRMDKWMLRFLFEFGKPVEEKTDYSFDDLWPSLTQSLQFSPIASETSLDL